MGSSLFGSGYGFGRAFAYAKQVAAFAAQLMYPRELSLSISPANPPRCRATPGTPHGVVQKRKLIHPSHHVDHRQTFFEPAALSSADDLAILLASSRAFP